MVKCDLCDKGITKRNPGLECRKCGKTVHGNQACSGLPAKQLAALRNSESLEWTCNECSLSTRRKSSFIVPDEDEDDDMDVACTENIGPIDVKKLLRDITSEVKKIVRKENESLEESLNFFGTKIEEVGNKIEVLAARISDIEKKQMYLVNKNKHLETTVSSLEIQIRKIEQSALDKMVEISGIPKTNKEDIKTIACNVAKMLTVDDKEIRSVKRIEGRPGSDGQLLVELGNAELATSWVQASRKETAPILAEHVVPSVLQEAAKSKVFVRLALSKSNKSLLWNAQQKLRPGFKYVWFQAGKVLARKGDGDKPIAIWCEEDIAQIAS